MAIAAVSVSWARAARFLPDARSPAAIGAKARAAAASNGIGSKSRLGPLEVGQAQCSFLAIVSNHRAHCEFS